MRPIPEIGLLPAPSAWASARNGGNVKGSRQEILPGQRRRSRYLIVPTEPPSGSLAETEAASSPKLRDGRLSWFRLVSGRDGTGQRDPRRPESGQPADIGSKEARVRIPLGLLACLASRSKPFRSLGPGNGGVAIRVKDTRDTDSRCVVLSGGERFDALAESRAPDRGRGVSASRPAASS